jgi:hypothetical protein
MRNILDKSMEKMKMHILCAIIFFRKSCLLCDKAKKFGEERETTNNAIVWRIRVTCWISKATSTHANALSHSPGHMQARAHAQICNTYCCFTATGYVNASQCSVTCVLPVLLDITQRFSLRIKSPHRLCKCCLNSLMTN